MLSRRGSFVAAVGLVVGLVAGCDSSHDSTTRHYSAEKFKRCMVSEHADITLTRNDRTASTVALLWWPRFAEWVYFYKTAGAASAARAKLKSETQRNHQVLLQLLRTQRSNTLVFAPAQQDWFFPIKRCLERARV
jgi:hypothetical protein